MKIIVGGRVKTKIVDSATGRCVKESPWQDNLVLDLGLNSLAGDGSQIAPSAPALMDSLVVGSGTTPTSTASGAVTFTQSNGSGGAGNILAASAGFFTAGMVGQLFKWGTGTGGVETYITAFSDTQHVTVDTSALIVVPAVGTVWAVNQTTLTTPLYLFSSYQTNSGDCGTTYPGNVNIQQNQRTFIFNSKVSVYSVNEIGYGPQLAAAGSKLAGRIVLAATDVIAPSQYYLVVFQFSATVVPGVPTAVGNVGTNMNTAGTAMVEGIGSDAFYVVGSNGVASGFGYLCAAASTPTKLLFAVTSAYSQNPHPESTLHGGADFGGAALIFSTGATWTKVVGVRGQMQCYFDQTMSTTGQTLYGVGIGSQSDRVFLDVEFTTPQTAPSGLFEPKTTWLCTWNRQLSN